MDQTEILPFIPQRPPFVMIDTLVQAGGDTIVTAFTVREEHMFVSEGYFTEPGLVENMAQSAAAGTGYRAQQEDKPAPVGFIGALKGLQVNELPPVGTTIRTEVHFLQQVMQAHLVMGKVMIGEREIASCEFKIFLQPE
jgi:3-hydroxyacyl-[acyl-carrier-protein] dehydratase